MTERQPGSTHTVYEIHVRGRLDRRWADWFEGLTLTHGEDGTTTLCGPLPDQAALHGVLNGIRDLGLPLVSVTSTCAPVEPPAARPNRDHEKDEGQEP